MDLRELWNSVNVEDGSVLGMKVEGDITPIALLSKIIVKVAGNYLLIDSYLLTHLIVIAELVGYLSVLS